MDNLWLVPLLPLLAAGCSALFPRSMRMPAAALAIGSMGAAFLLSCVAFAATLGGDRAGGVFRQVRSFTWFSAGDSVVRLGWVLDPLTACMLMMVTFVGLLIFIYSVGYMAHDANFTRFFCFLSLFASAMLGLLISNSLLLLFICWELVGLASYLLIGFWFEKPSAAAAAKKAFIVTRIGDVGFFLGILWLYAETGTLLFYDGGNGCLEASALTQLGTVAVAGGMAASTGIGLLLFCGAAGKSGQVPLHVWLPDAMEGPTPVSALIHAATMVAAGVFLMARVHPLLSVGAAAGGVSPALQVVSWVGAITALFAALIAVAQTDIKRILAYSTVSQLGFMMLGLGTGGVAVGMFHLITHAFFKALLFLGAGSVIHGCHEEQDIRRMGGLRERMPVTFATYAVGMMALAGFPIFFSGFWSKDEILHAAQHWGPSHVPFYMACGAAVLTAFYMTRQVCLVFFGRYRGPVDKSHAPHESPPVMTGPLMILAFFAVVLGFFGTPAWPWFEGYLAGHATAADFGKLFRWETLSVLLLSTILVAVGVSAGWKLYGTRPMKDPTAPDPLERWQPDLFGALRDRFYVDELYEGTVVRLNAALSRLAEWMERSIWNGAMRMAGLVTLGISWLNRFVDEFVVNRGFDEGCRGVRGGGGLFGAWQNGQVQSYLRVIGLALVGLLLLLSWGCQP